MNDNKTIRVILLLAVAVAVFVVLETVSLPTSTYLWAEIHNFGHTPLFGLLSLALFGLSLNLLGRWINNRFLHYLIAFTLAFLLGLLSEITQILEPRNADISDQVRNTAGIIGFLGLWLGYDRQLRNNPRKSRGGVARLARWGAIAVLIASTVPTILWSDAYLHRGGYFPVLCSFEYYQERMFIRPHQSDLETVLPPATWYTNQSGNAASVTFHRETTFPGFIITDPSPDWTDYRFLTFEVFSELDSAVNIYMTIEDDHHNRQYEDRFNHALKIIPGINPVRIPLNEVRTAPAGRTMDMKAVASINIFGHEPPESLVLLFDDFKLQ